MTQSDSIDIRSLHFFMSVYEMQNFSQVARREGVSASMISRTIHQLEDSLGQQLFYRNTRAITPTDAGRLFFEHALKITEQFEQAQKQLQDRKQEPSGLVRINAPVFFGQYHIAPWLAGLSARYPKLAIELNQTDEFIDPLRENTDIIFRIGPLRDSSYHARIFGQQIYHLGAAPEYLKTHGKLTAPEQLVDHQCLVYKGFEGANRWLARQSANQTWTHYPIEPKLVSNNAQSLLTTAISGMGIVLFPDWLMGQALKQGQLIELLPDYELSITTHAQHIAAIYPNVRHPPLNVRAVIDYFSEIYGSPLYWQK
ncbi:LysR substrate-binding domain-containing protein [Celerinatantimonas sp. MCCC 1A17872]|uniref:LysR family transcriptional regulator n=1 Tax=Celerinatantimonas sp. MCCC 1A17872 TaxID=3177514 RepID=UPI0038BEBBB9